MHTFRSHEKKPGIYRRHWRFGLPENPVCWLFGHRGKVTVVEPRYNIEPWLFEECRWCGRRYRSSDGYHAVSHLPADERPREARRILAARVENARRDPKGFARQLDGRVGFEPRDSGVNVEAVYYPRYHKAWRWSSVVDNLGFKIHTGGRSSETPYDLAGHFGVGSVYLSVEGIGARFAEWIGRGHSRDLSLTTHDGSLWWKVWYDGQSGNDEHHRCDKWRRPRLWPWSAGREKYRSWLCLRDGAIDLNPVSAFYGPPLYHYEDVGQMLQAFVRPAEGERYLVDFQLRRQRRHRDHGPAWARRLLEEQWVAEWRSDGIPVRNHEWKGDNVLGSSVRVESDYGREPSAVVWLPEAVRRVEEQVRRDRARYDYRAPQEV